MSIYLYLACSVLALVISVSLFKIAFRLLNIDKASYKQLHKNAGRLGDPFRGHMTYVDHDVKDSRHARGLVFDKKKKKILPQATLSDEELDVIV